MVCFPPPPLLFSEGFPRGKTAPIRHSRKRPMKAGKRPINANGLFSGTPPWSKTAPLKRPIKRSMKLVDIAEWQNRMRLFCLQLEASCLQWSFLTYN